MSRGKAAISCIVGALLLAVVFLFNSCGNKGGGTPSGSVALYATDDNMVGFQQVIATINKVTVKNSGSKASCDVMTTPVTINIANLSDVLQLLNVASCPAVPYNRLDMVFNKSVELMDAQGNQSTCSFTSYKDGAGNVNRLLCSGTTCTLDINGAVNVLVNEHNKVALDFRLKDFDVYSAGTASCSVTMKVSPLHAMELEHLSRLETITGLVTDLTTSTRAFTLTRGHLSLNVLYSGITSTQQPGLDALLLRAEQDALKTAVTASFIDFANKTIEASKIIVKAEGLVSNLTASTNTFTLTYKKGKTMTVDYSKAIVRGTLADDAMVEVKLYGYDGTNFLAARIEVEYEASVPDDLKQEMDTED